MAQCRLLPTIAAFAAAEGGSEHSMVILGKLKRALQCAVTNSPTSLTSLADVVLSHYLIQAL